MKLKTNLIAIGVVVALGAGQQVVAAQKKEEDSVYKWGRWAVLSPAAGGPPPYVAALAPDAVNNARPEEAEEFSPKILGLEQPTPVPGPVEPPPGDPRDRLPPPPVVEIPEPVPGPIEPPTGDPRDRLPPLATQ
jgi:hypothetical protein